LAAGLHARAVPGLAAGFAAVRGAHRFGRHDAVTRPRLSAPPPHLARPWRPQAPETGGLVRHAWSRWSYPKHQRQTDQVKTNHGRGDALTTVLLVEGSAGDPVAPRALRRRAAQGVGSPRTPAPGPAAFRRDAVLPSRQAGAGLGWGERRVPVSDRAADSLAPYRAGPAAGRYVLVRTQGGRTVRWPGAERSRAPRAGRRAFRRGRAVRAKGHQAVPHVAEAAVGLDRPAWRPRRRGGRVVNERVPGPPLPRRLVVSRVCDATGRTRAVWYVLTNLPAAGATAAGAWWSYGRWRIESLFQRLQSAGHQVEHGPPASAAAIAKRLVVAALAYALVWRLARQPSAEAASLRALLVPWSGRQMKWGQESTAPALRAGLWVLRALVEALEKHSVEDRRRFKQLVLGTAEEDSG
jgi:hypothetical protein